MPFDVEEFVRYQIMNAKVRGYPFPHLYVSPIFPPDYYELLQRNLPPTAWYRPLEETNSVKPTQESAENSSGFAERFIADLADVEEREEQARTGDFWRRVSEWITGNRFHALVVRKFEPAITARFGAGAKLATGIDARLVRDFSRYAIGPHTDSKTKLVSLLFYLPKDAAMSHLGTSIYAPVDPSFRCPGGPHHPFGMFRKVATMPFAPNALFGFFKTDRSFHGVDQILDDNVERNLLLYNIYVRKVSKRAVRKWPWSALGGRASD